MSRKPTAALSASLVAVKGTAAPAPDMPGRAAPAPQSEPAATAAQDSAGQDSTGQDSTGGMPLNFRVPENFRREFKVYAAQHGLKLNELLRRSFEAFRRENAK